MVAGSARFLSQMEHRRRLPPEEIQALWPPVGYQGRREELRAWLIDCLRGDLRSVAADCPAERKKRESRLTCISGLLPFFIT